LFSYYAVCVVYIGLIMLCAIFIDDLTLVFGLIGAFSETMLNFVFPGFFFLIGSALVLKGSHNKQVKIEVEDSDDDNYQDEGMEPRAAAIKLFCKKFPVYLFILTGIGFFFTSNFFNILKILRL